MVAKSSQWVELRLFLMSKRHNRQILRLEKFVAWPAIHVSRHERNGEPEVRWNHFQNKRIATIGPRLRFMFPDGGSAPCS